MRTLVILGFVCLAGVNAAPAPQYGGFMNMMPMGMGGGGGGYNQGGFAQGGSGGGQSMYNQGGSQGGFSQGGHHRQFTQITNAVDDASHMMGGGSQFHNNGAQGGGFNNFATGQQAGGGYMGGAFG